MAVLPVGAGRRDLAEVDLRVEVRGEGIAVVAAVAVEDVDGVDLVKIVPGSKPVPSRPVRPALRKRSS